MVSRRDKQRMQDFVVDRIEDAGKYSILKADAEAILITQKPELFENPKKIGIFLHNTKMPIAKYESAVRQAAGRGIFISSVFCKDGINFMVRLAERSFKKGSGRSLKEYSPDELSKMIHLRGLEKAVLGMQETALPAEGFAPLRLTYFQPETVLLSESLRRYDLLDVELDYSHVDNSHRSYGFARDRTSVDYKIAREIKPAILSGGIRFSQSSPGSRLLVINPAGDS